MMKTEDDDIGVGAAAAAASGSAHPPPPPQSRSREAAASAAAVAAEEVEEAAQEEEAATATATALQDLIAGGVAGSASVIVGHPFDTYKVRLQTSAPTAASSKSSSAASPAAAASASSKQFGGASSLFRGMSAPLATACVVNAMIFSAFGESSRYWDEYHSSDNDDGDGGDVAVEGKPLRRYQTGSGVGVDSDGTAWRGHVSSGGHKHHHHHNRHDYADDNVHMHAEGHLTHCNYEDNSSEDSVANDIGGSNSNNNLTKSLVCGSFAGLVQCLVICPMEHVKCRLQVQHGGGGRQKLYRGPLDAVDKIVSGHGVSGLFRGWWVTALREVPAFGLYFATYDDIKDRINRMFEEADEKNRGGDVVANINNPPDSHHHRHSHEWAASAVAGGISGSLTWAIIYPVDVIKSRIQTAPLDCDPSRRKMWSVGRDIVRENGWRYMFRGLGVTLARAFPVNGIIFPVYEFTLMKLTQAGIGG